MAEQELTNISELDSVNVAQGERLYNEYQHEIGRTLANDDNNNDVEAANTVELQSFFEDSLKSKFHVFILYFF